MRDPDALDRFILWKDTPVLKDWKTFNYWKLPEEGPHRDACELAAFLSPKPEGASSVHGSYVRLPGKIVHIAVVRWEMVGFGTFGSLVPVCVFCLNHVPDQGAQAHLEACSLRFLERELDGGLTLQERIEMHLAETGAAAQDRECPDDPSEGSD